MCQNYRITRMKTILKFLLAAVMLLALPLGISAQKGGQWFIVGDFCDGMAYVKHQRTELYGYVNQSRKLVIPCKWSRAGDFHDGLAYVQDRNGKWGHINKSGKVVNPCKWAEAGSFFGGLASVKDPKSLLYGFIDKTGKLVIPCKWAYVGDFRNGTSNAKEPGGDWVTIDKTGKIVE